MVMYGLDAPEDPPAEGESVRFVVARGERDTEHTGEVRGHEPTPGDGYTLKVRWGEGVFTTEYSLDTSTGEVASIGHKDVAGVLTNLEILSDGDADE